LLSKFSDHATQAVLSLAMGLIGQVLQRVGVHEGASAARGGEDVIAFQLLIGPSHGIGIEFEIVRELADRRQGFAGQEPLVQDCPLDLLDDLLVGGLSVGGVNNVYGPLG